MYDSDGFHITEHRAWRAPHTPKLFNSHASPHNFQLRFPIFFHFSHFHRRKRTNKTHKRTQHIQLSVWCSPKRIIVLNAPLHGYIRRDYSKRKFVFIVCHTTNRSLVILPPTFSYKREYLNLHWICVLIDRSQHANRIKREFLVFKKKNCRPQSSNFII